MLNNIKKSIKISFLQRAGLLTAIASLLLLGFANVSLAQYYTAYTPVNITTTNATNITDTSVVLNGLVNGSTMYSTANIETWFQYGADTNMTYSTIKINSNSGYADFSLSVSDLSSNTVYYYRAVGQTAQGFIYGETNSFRTNFASVTENIDNDNSTTTSSPATLTAITEPASSVSSSSVRLNSLIFNPSNENSNTWFEYGTTVNLGTTTPPISTGGLPSVNHINTLTGLAPDTVYYFRAVVQNSDAMIDGSVLSFTTSSGRKSVTKPVVVSTNNAVTNTNNTTSSSLSSSLGANIFGAGSFLPINIFGWLILLILILILILLAQHPNVRFWGDKNNNAEQEHP